MYFKNKNGMSTSTKEQPSVEQRESMWLRMFLPGNPFQEEKPE